ncbi:MAG: hypothetical protein R6X02_30285 [Enhygromyxa sp.]
METSYHGFFVGPVSCSEAADAAIERAGVSRARVVERRGPGVWIVLELAHEAEALVRCLADGTWLWEVELRNDFGADFGDDTESHSGTLDARQWRSGELVPRTHHQLSEEGFIRGGVMEEAALEYIAELLRIEADAALERGEGLTPGPSASQAPRRRIASQPEDPAAALIEHLLQCEDLEIVNHHARRTLLAPLEQCLLEPTAAAAAAAILAVLEDADEVVEVYADEAELEAFITDLRQRSELP